MTHPVGETYAENLIDPQVMADMIYEKLTSKLVMTPYVKVDTRLQGRPGSTVTVPVTKYIGDAVNVAEGEDIPVRELHTDIGEYTIKKAGIGTVVTDEAVLNSLGDPLGNSTAQIAKSVSSKIDNDEVEALLSASTAFTATASIGYAPVVDAIDLFEEEAQQPKVILVNPHQVTQLRKDKDFIDANKYDGKVIMNGEIGRIAGASVVPSKKIPIVKENGIDYYVNPIIQVGFDSETENDTPALTIYLKRGINIEKDRKARARKTEITGDQMYVAALTDETKVVLLKTLAEESVEG